MSGSSATHPDAATQASGAGSEHLWDVVVIGSGMGGAMAAAVLSQAGHSTLVLESARPPREGKVKLSFKAKLKAKISSKPTADPGGERWPDPLLLRSHADASYREVPSVVARIPGGSSQVYGAALARARRTDFEQDWQPDAWLPGAQQALPNAWPVTFDEMRGYYERAEQLFRVAGTRDPLDTDDDADLLPPPPVSATIAKLAERLEANGRHPFRMHVGIDYVPGCKECQGERCLRLCKSDSFTRALREELTSQRARLRTDASVECITPRRAGGYNLVVRSAAGETDVVSARRVVLAAGALNTPLILQRSPELWPEGRVPALVGGGLMFHFGDIFAILNAGDRSPAHGPMKVLGFRDHYIDGVMPLAECQSLGMAGSPWMVSKYLEGEAMEMGIGKLPMLRLITDVIGTFASAMFKRSVLFTSNLEDLPYASNRVDAAGDSVVPGLGRVAVTYHAPDELLMRAKRFRKLMREAFAPFSVRFLKRLGAPNLGHPMGTCRMGTSPETSVTAPDGSVWGHEGLYVVDASVFPSSLGINPALTVAANAMRVAEGIAAIAAGARPCAKGTGEPCVD
ncbi:GMC family oxidoreductase [Novosphingobium sp. ERN07]|uniref:GMC oxidoreductase n=1 Tax=Novosphingobium sp. ERN07 TaxID=2726187 RepID=UPI0014568535|nr:GMC family oxidoreductase [Novosphingobium sp. ERN07]